MTGLSPLSTDGKEILAIVNYNGADGVQTMFPGKCQSKNGIIDEGRRRERLLVFVFGQYQ